MTLSKLAGLVEIRTKAASVIPFAIGTLYALFHFQTFQGLNFVLMLLSLLCIDMATTAINNYCDYKKARKRDGYGYEKHNAIVKYSMKEWQVLAVIGLLFVCATVLGVLLVLRTDLVVLGLGALSFAIGILYSFGPIPISRLPLGELFSGLFMGSLIIFLAAYIHVSDLTLIGLAFESGVLGITFDVKEIALLLAVSIPAVCGIANIMLANNICDREEDIANGRYTLPVFIGRSHALTVFRVLYVVSYLDLIVLYYLGVHPLLLAALLLTFIPLRRKVRAFRANPVKAQTFILSVQSFVLICGARIVVLGASLFI